MSLIMTPRELEAWANFPALRYIPTWLMLPFEPPVLKNTKSPSFSSSCLIITQFFSHIRLELRSKSMWKTVLYTSITKPEQSVPCPMVCAPAA
ncbi:Uncharacterised protein [Chlamydia trachomatis]|nr:Uncharacterised protein [Chlamydia trachomatis]